MRTKLKNVVYKYTNVFSTELSNKAALVQPYSIPLKPDNDWITNKNRHPPCRKLLPNANAQNIQRFTIQHNRNLPG